MNIYEIQRDIAGFELVSVVAAEDSEEAIKLLNIDDHSPLSVVKIGEATDDISLPKIIAIESL